MSAFMCSEDHIRVLAVAAVYGAGPDAVRMANTALATCETNAIDDASAYLYEANRASLRALYREREQPTIGEPLITRAHLARITEHLLNPLVVIKLAKCYEYQACDWKQWDGSEAQELCNAAVSMAVTSLPGYDAAPWGL